MLEGAIAHEQVDVLFQPLIEPATGRVVGAEALARSPIADGQLLFARASARGIE
jgi:sensor c-di-GMP phosphodiesterase-like protein